MYSYYSAICSEFTFCLFVLLLFGFVAQRPDGVSSVLGWVMICLVGLSICCSWGFTLRQQFLNWKKSNENATRKKTKGELNKVNTDRATDENEFTSINAKKTKCATIVRTGFESASTKQALSDGTSLKKQCKYPVEAEPLKIEVKVVHPVRCNYDD